MKYFKRIFLIQLKFLPILGLIVYVVGAIVYELNFKDDISDYKTLPKKEFFDVAIKNRVDDYEKFDDYIKMELPNEAKYKWKLNYAGEENELEDTIIKLYSNYSVSDNGGSSSQEESYYLIAIPAILSTIVAVLGFNLVVILWLFVFYDLMKSEFTENQNKWMWLVCLILIPFITPTFYWLISEKQKKSTNTI